MSRTTLYDEERIVEKLHHQATCREAFAEVIDHYSQPLYWHIRRMVITHDDANDVLQNTYLKAWSNIDNFRGDAKLTTWLYKIATNESITFLEKKKQQTGVPLDSEDASAVVAELEADQWFDGDETQMKLQQAIALLPEKQRLVFNMRYYGDMKYEQISDVLDTSVGALKASYHHALKKIEAFFINND